MRHQVVFASDNQGVEPLGVAIYSLLSSARATTGYDIYVLALAISADNQRRLCALVEQVGRGAHRLTFRDISDGLLSPELLTSWQWPLAAWARIFIPSLLPELTGQVLYLDIDVLICRDLSELFETDLQGRIIGAVMEERSHAGSGFNQRLAVPLDAPGYFNSGVLLMDVCRYRAEGVLEQILSCVATRRGLLHYPDQDALNSVLCRRWTPIHPRWNWHDGNTRHMLGVASRVAEQLHVPVAAAVDAALHPGVLHYMGPRKPWRANYRPEGDRYAGAMRASGFGTFPLPGQTFSTALKSVLYRPVYWLTWGYLHLLDALLSLTDAGGSAGFS